MKLLKTHVIASILAVTTMFGSIGTQAVADTDIAETEIVETVDFGALMPSCAENVKNTYKERYPECSDLIDSIVDLIISDGEFIECFEAEGPVAFQIVADALNDSLKPKTYPYSFDNESYFSKYSSYPCNQLYSHYDGPAAVVQALMGSGCIDYTQNKSTLNSYQRTAASVMGTNSTSNTSIYKITAYLQEKYAEKFGQNTSGTFQTRVFNSSNANSILDYITTSLAADTEPILRVPDRSALYDHEDTGPLYITVNTADDQGQYIVYTDPSLNSGGGRSMSYNELKDLTQSGNVWLSTYYSKSSREFPLAAYPAGSYVSGARSYYTSNGRACYDHNGDVGSNCMYYDGGWQCYAFANYIYHVASGKYFSNGTATTLNLKNQSSSSLKSYLQGLPTGTHLRVYTKNGSQHSMALVGTSTQGITVYHANYDTHCGVYYDTFTWEEYANKFPDLTFYVAP